LVPPDQIKVGPIIPQIVESFINNRAEELQGRVGGKFAKPFFRGENQKAGEAKETQGGKPQ
jgi:hypothetical protein